MTSAGGLLAVHAHPDDETLATGALLAACSAAGLATTVVTCTRGERGEVIGDALAHLEGDGPALAQHREQELAAALAALGVREHRFLDRVPLEGAGPDGARYEDSGMAWLATGRAGRADEAPERAFVSADLDAAAARLARVLVERRPAVVVTYEPGGGYGHPDHVRAHEVTTRAVELVAAAGSDVPVVLWAAQDGEALRAGYRALAGDAVASELGARLRGADAAGHRCAPLVLPDPDGPLPSVACDASAIDAQVDVEPVRDAVLAALRAHATQVQAVRGVDGEPALVGCFALSNLVLAPLLPVEAYRLARPSDRAALRALVVAGWPLRLPG